MTTLLLIALSLHAAIFLTLVPFIVKFLNTTIIKKEYQLFKTMTKDATSYVNQLSLSNEYSSENKKLLAITYTSRLLQATDIKRFNDLIEEQIESSLWSNDNEIIEDDGDEDEDF